jgi:type II secretory pathway pseudopilin PulG
VLVVVAILVILAGAATVGVMRYLEDAKIDRAKMDMTAIQKAYMNYYTKSGGTWPPDVTYLVAPTDGTAAMIEGGIAAVTSPWNELYTVQAVPGVDGRERVVVMCQTPNGTLQVPQQ